MNDPSHSTQTAEQNAAETITTSASASTHPQPSYTKLAMRNMVRKRGTSLTHFALTTAGLMTLLIGLAYLTR